MKGRLLYLVRFYLTTVLLFVIAKVVFMFCNGAGHDIAVTDVWQVVSHGLSLDLSVSLYLLIVPFLFAVSTIFFGTQRLSRIIMSAYNLFVAVILALTFVADTSLYAFWQFKLDASCLQYLETPTEAMASVTGTYIAVRVLLFVVIVSLIYFVYTYPRHHLVKSSHRWRETEAAIVCIPLIIIGIRGGLSESTTNIGQVYFSHNQFLNHAAVNPLFSFLSSIGKSGDSIIGYNYFTDDECARLTEGLFDTDSVNPDTLLNSRQPNIVLIIMESCGGQFTQMGGHPEIMPHLNSLSSEGVFFSQCYANSWRTDKGVVSILSGYPAFPITSVMKIPEKSRKLPSIASTLAAEGYSTSFYYGGDINFTNMRSYLMSTGYQGICWKSDFSYSEQNTAKWGVRDDIMFNTLLSDIKQEKADHWMKTLLTLSSHEPWDVPTKQLDDPVYNAFNYLDICLNDFIRQLRQLPIWENLLVVILPDHGYRYKGINETTRLYNHIPMLWLGGAVKEPHRVEALCNQSDLPATLLGQMGLSHTDFTFSRDVVGSNYRMPTAWHTFNNGATLYDSTGFVAYDLDAETVIAHEGNNTEELLQRSKALLQLTSHDLRKK